MVGGRGDAGSLDIGGNTIDGQHYDHVISVEIDDRGAPLRLGVNRSDNPYTVADKCVAPPTLVCHEDATVIAHAVNSSWSCVQLHTDA